MADKIVKELEIKNIKGLHARAAAAFVKTVEPFDATVEVERIGQCVNGCSIMGLMMLAASKGTTIKVSASGKQAQEVMTALETLLNNKFGEN
ncbi:MAG: HPr family phosphocarrier protein [bacterium]|nr:HPr family phosphocarrier protein [bacterium]MDY2830420.1 HPr family phosphocarrier protein [Alphaproteobacteria bacterium]